ncbi:PREDICTED: CD151 antigen isoform X2 [Papilio xuthus]|uniref:Tetraspanin n=1 Tax=Papilio xuthus TaxID=66420 RepID=A0AAJ6ZM79_PAPXU|nr:PREDICTED: CD151 antigen isoform X2 [Papilio xuthus]XP_013175303.1 PREDICTED: CD151 antigen isoform X2 [Papilio xuthus]XP_013175305.1 PREDICTED: CD151 antigen isoform X2 [Papilio xuthus]XP_013175306.1 PREDICTED: CD151 antigen isoform X2 [Papilio xuthus]
MAEEKKKKDSSALLSKKKKVKPRKSRDADCLSVNFLKCVLHIFNVIFMFAGIGVLIVGAWTVASRHRFVPLLPTPTYPAIAYLLVIAGGMGVPLCALGCCGLKTENRTSLLCYTYFLLFTFILELGAGGLAYYYEVAVEFELKAELNNTFIANYALDVVVTDAVDLMQTEFKCCGASRYSDWRRSAWHQHDPRLLVPDSCCKTVTSRCGMRDHPSNIYHNGCVTPFTSHIREHLIILAAVGVGMSVIPIFGFLFSCILYVKIKHVID